MSRQRGARHVPERFLRQLWKAQEFDSLRTLDGRPIEVVSPGQLNTDGGPDFSGARIRIGGVLYAGAVELHQSVGDWCDHQHDRDPKYNGVILHIVLHRGGSDAPPSLTESNRSVPVLVLQEHLRSGEHATWQSMILDERAERLSAIPCYPANERVDASVIRSWITKLATERMELKVRRFEERLRELVDHERPSIREPQSRYDDDVPFGINPEDLPSPIRQYSAKDFSMHGLWNQILYEGMMEALGYAKNQAPFLKLARTLDLETIAHLLAVQPKKHHSAFIEAGLFGVAGLLPTRKLPDDYVATLQTDWGKLRTYYHGESLNESEWQFFRLRPENFPTVRIAGAAQIIPKLLSKNFFRTIVQSVKDVGRKRQEVYRSLVAAFTVREVAGFWSTHYTIDEESPARVSTLIGKNRATEIVLNVVIPICLLYARIFKDKEVRRGTLKVFSECPAASDNAITRRIDDQLLRGRLKLDSAMLQQGALQLYKRYCTEKRCGECAVGREVFGG
jgi:hypothetical protein